MDQKICSLLELEREAERFLASLTPASGATLVTLSGHLGAGKTAFVQACARVLGVHEPVTSPTFVIQKSYTVRDEKARFSRLVHIDAYRLEGGAELEPLHFAELMQDSTNLILLEWPEKVSDALPPAHIRIALVLQDDGSRLLTYA